MSDNDDPERISLVVSELDKMSEDDRLAVFAHFCRFCGNSDPGCYCWNDE